MKFCLEQLVQRSYKGDTHSARSEKLVCVLEFWPGHFILHDKLKCRANEAHEVHRALFEAAEEEDFLLLFVIAEEMRWNLLFVQQMDDEMHVSQSTLTTPTSNF